MKQAILFAAVLAVGGSAAAYADPAPAVVTIRDFAYKPSELTIHVGDTVQFVNNDDVGHTVTANDGSFDSKGLDSGKSWTYTFPTAGTYAYFCTVHPSMQGKIVVSPAN